MQNRKRRLVDEEYEPVRKRFFDRHPGLKWALIGIAVGLFAAAIAVSLAVTLGAGIVPFIQIGAALGLADATLAATAGIAIIAGGAMAAFGAIFGTIAAIVSHCRRPRMEVTELEAAPSTAPLLASRPGLTNEQIAEQQANLRASATGSRMFSAAETREEEAAAPSQQLVV